MRENETKENQGKFTVKLALMDIEDHKCELGDILTKLDDTLRKLK